MLICSDRVDVDRASVVNCATVDWFIARRRTDTVDNDECVVRQQRQHSDRLMMARHEHIQRVTAGVC